ncbi:hypothetical protein [Actinokineospora globicatena]|uniref:Uncharacterized protein n=1 Tax=Actinokineospora globicatena TaxID=103729 RepID=A0A9W6QSK4_9PSEU|nr:hypothetical protein [Actinokineospora globicatena]GLW94030.1 hypothetical protein Aglo03_48460 [Actinokineospora globicatena]
MAERSLKDALAIRLGEPVAKRSLPAGSPGRPEWSPVHRAGVGSFGMGGTTCAGPLGDAGWTDRGTRPCRRTTRET